MRARIASQLGEADERAEDGRKFCSGGAQRSRRGADSQSAFPSPGPAREGTTGGGVNCSPHPPSVPIVVPIVRRQKKKVKVALCWGWLVEGRGGGRWDWMIILRDVGTENLPPPLYPCPSHHIPLGEEGRGDEESESVTGRDALPPPRDLELGMEHIGGGGGWGPEGAWDGDEEGRG
ncbi:hypothetical protein niasHT_027762 [Heterodera trifolii]|uniref:Uncharacterized protein n=1 Tax=Heterodera trifolii TaxID=157864 RepID=A0ABD2KIB3_9BILA